VGYWVSSPVGWFIIEVTKVNATVPSYMCAVFAIKILITCIKVECGCIDYLKVDVLVVRCIAGI
jgi:hypothetical protein